MEQDLQQSRKAAYAAGTQKNHQTFWRTYITFCLYFKLRPRPASTHTVCLFAQFLSRSHTPKSVSNYVVGVKLLHLMGGFEPPSLQSFEFRITMKGIERLAKHTPNRAPPIIPEILQQLAAVCDLTDRMEVTFLCSFLFTFFLFARVSNIVPTSSAKFDVNMHLCRGDIFETSSGLLVLFKWTKTIQFNQRRLFIPLVSLQGSNICPVHMFHKMCDLSAAPKSAPAFVARVSTSNQFISIDKGQYISFLRQKLELAGVTRPQLYRGHSFCRGAATFAFNSGVSGELIQVFGDWVSDAYKQYLEYSLEAKAAVASKMSRKILSLLN